MSSTISKLLRSIFPWTKNESRCLIMGNDAAGKTTILYKLKLGEIVTTIPTIGFNVENVLYGGIEFIFWDVGGCDKIRPLWRHYYNNNQCIIYVIDSNDKDRLVGDKLDKYSIFADSGWKLLFQENKL